MNRGKLMDRCMLIDKWKDTSREIDRSIFKQIDGLIDRYLDRQINGKSFRKEKKNMARRYNRQLKFMHNRYYKK